MNSSPPLFTTSKFENLDEYIKSLLLKCGKTLPFIIINELFSKEKGMKLSEIYEIVSADYNTLRKPDGTKYGNNLKRVIASTLHSTGLFMKSPDDFYTINKNEVIKYLERNSIKTITANDNVSNDTKINNEIKNGHENENDNVYLGRKRIIKKTLGGNANPKFIHAYTILDEILEKYSNDKKISKNLINPFAKCDSSLELLIKLGNSDKLIGMVTCFKIFKPILKKVFFMKNKITKKTLNGMKGEILNLEQGIDFVRRMLEMNNTKNIIN